MATKTSLRITMTDIAKLIGATILFFLWLTIGVQQVGTPSSLQAIDYFSLNQEKEHLSPDFKENFSIDGANNLYIDGILLTSWEVEEYKKKYDEEVLGKEAMTAEEKRNYDLSLLNKVVFSGELHPEDKNYYLYQYLRTISFLDQNLRIGNDIKKVFKELKLNTDEEKGKRRGGATRDTVRLNLAQIRNDSEYMGVLTHELGHIVDLGVLQGMSKIKNGNFTEFGKAKFEIDDPSLEYYRYSWESELIRAAHSGKEDFCSGYGLSNPFEDFAECLNLYLRHNFLFRHMGRESVALKNKYNYFANLFWNYSIEEGERNPPLALWRPRDTTKL